MEELIGDVILSLLQGVRTCIFIHVIAIIITLFRPFTSALKELLFYAKESDIQQRKEFTELAEASEGFLADRRRLTVSLLAGLFLMMLSFSAVMGNQMYQYLWLGRLQTEVNNSFILCTNTIFLTGLSLKLIVPLETLAKRLNIRYAYLLWFLANAVLILSLATVETIELFGAWNEM